MSIHPDSTTETLRRFIWRIPRAHTTLLVLLMLGLAASPALANKIRLVSGEIDTEKAPQATMQSLMAKGGAARALVVIALEGPTESGWLEEIRAAGVTIHHYLPDNAYLATMSTSVPVDAGSLPHVSWVGSLPDHLKIHPALAVQASKAKSSAYPPSEMAVTVLSVDSDITAALEAWGYAPSSSRRSASGWYDTRVEVPASRLTDVSELWNVFHIEAQPDYQLNGERAAQTAAGNFNQGALAPFGPGYADFLADNGLTGGAGLVAQVQDDGLDQGNASNLPGTAHADIVGRITGIFNATSDPLGDSEGGHGQINTGIMLGNASVGTTDGDGYLLGQGVAPQANVYATKIFRNSGAFDIGANSFSDLAKDAQDAGTILSNNSWGTPVGGAYTADSAEFDMLTRDADSTEPGNQPILYFFAAGNSGSGANTLGAPATAKNVISVGAAENSDADGTDGCDTGPSGADNLRDLISFSSRGPNDDGRLGVTVVSVGTHNQGPVSTAPGFNGSSVCDTSWPFGQSDYARSSGTSLSSPTAAGAGLVVYEIFQTHLAPLGHTATPSPAMMKAVLTNTATDLVGGFNGSGGSLVNVPNPQQGWGSVNLSNLLSMTHGLTTVDQTEVFSSSGDSFDLRVFPVDPSLAVKVTLAWTDAPAVPLANPTLVNNLDLVVSDGAASYLGNVFSLGASTTGGSADELNNLESVFISNPTGGPIDIRVAAANIAGDGIPGFGDDPDQDFALFVWNGVTQASAGTVRFAREVNCTDSGDVTVNDSDLAGAGTQAVTLTSSEGDSESLVLTELGSGVFVGSIATSDSVAIADDGVLQVTDGGVAIATYEDADDGTGSAAVAVDNTVADCTAPLISNLSFNDITSSEAVVEFDTSEAADVQVDFGLSCDATASSRVGASNTTHAVVLSGLPQDTQHFVAVTATDAAGNVATDDNGGSCFDFSTLLLADNLGFELNDFTGWSAQDLASPYYSLRVGGVNTVGPRRFVFFHSEPTEGNFAALHGFDGDEGTIRLARDISIPVGALSVSFDYRAAWDLKFGATMDRTFRVEIEPIGGGAALQSETVLTAPAGTMNPDTGAQVGSINVTSFAGQNVRLSFEWIIPESFTGPGYFQLDNVGVVADSDGDGISDAVDNCQDVPNPKQQDSNQDGFGNICDMDLDNNGFVGLADFALFLSRFATTCEDPIFDADSDFNGDCTVSFQDFWFFVESFQQSPGPSGLFCAGRVPCR